MEVALYNQMNWKWKIYNTRKTCQYLGKWVEIEKQQFVRKFIWYKYVLKKSIENSNVQYVNGSSSSKYLPAFNRTL
jgi:hypothetical protein